jgi:hypothetical protein
MARNATSYGGRFVMCLPKDAHIKKHPNPFNPLAKFRPNPKPSWGSTCHDIDAKHPMNNTKFAHVSKAIERLNIDGETRLISWGNRILAYPSSPSVFFFALNVDLNTATCVWSGETIALNFTVDWMGNKEEERVWVCQSLERWRHVLRCMYCITLLGRWIFIISPARGVRLQNNSLFCLLHNNCASYFSPPDLQRTRKPSIDSILSRSNRQIENSNTRSTTLSFWFILLMNK